MYAKVIASNVALVAVLVSPLALAFISGCAAIAGAEGAKPGLMCWILVALASAVAFFNFYLAFLRPFLYAKRHGNASEGYNHASCIPVVGSILTVAALIAGWAQMPVAIAGLILLLADVGGTVWFLAIMSRDRSFWTGRLGGTSRSS